MFAESKILPREWRQSLETCQESLLQIRSGKLSLAETKGRVFSIFRTWHRFFGILDRKTDKSGDMIMSFYQAAENAADILLARSRLCSLQDDFWEILHALESVPTRRLALWNMIRARKKELSLFQLGKIVFRFRAVDMKQFCGKPGEQWKEDWKRSPSWLAQPEISLDAAEIMLQRLANMPESTDLAVIEACVPPLREKVSRLRLSPKKKSLFNQVVDILASKAKEPKVRFPMPKWSLSPALQGRGQPAK